MKKDLSKILWLNTASFTIGLFYAAIDVMTSGQPIVSGGLMLYDVAKLASIPSEYRFTDYDKKQPLKVWSDYMAGAAMPFIVDNFNEIYSFAEGILK